jgi:hypothetical protein
MGARAFVLRALVALCAGASALGLPSSALAGYVHKYVTSFGSFSDVQGVAVDSSSGIVYVYDGGNGEVLKFDAAGAPVDFSSTGSNVLNGVGFAGGDEGEIAVDSSSGPARGDIYVAHADGSIEIYSSAGSKLGELTEEAGVPWGEACGVAVDASGAVYVGLYPSSINKYVPTGNPVTNADYASTINGVNSVCNVGADSLGNAYSVTWSSGPVTRYEASQFGSLSAAGDSVDGKGSSMSVDPANDEVYVDEQDQIAQFGSNGEPFDEPVATFGASGPGAISSSIGIAVSGFNGDIYVSDGKGALSVFGAGVVVPDVVTGASSDVQSTSATISGTVNPDGVAITECKVEYGTTGSYGQNQACSESAGEIGSGSSPVEVHANLTGLNPGSTYHYRLVAANASGQGEGEDATLSTPGAPLVSDEAFSDVAGSEAVVSAQIDPNFASTTYHVEYGTSEAYGQSTSESAPIGSDHSAHTVSAHIAGLTAGTSYHFRFVATNSVASADGADATFATYPPAAVSGGCSNEARREEQDAMALPDCRAYEMVSPLDKNGADIFGAGNTVAAAIGGEAAEYMAQVGFGQSNGSGVIGLTQYLAVREATEGWVSHGITPTPERESFQGIGAGITLLPNFSEDLGKSLATGADLPAASPGGIPRGENLYVEDNMTGALVPITTPLAEPITALQGVFQINTMAISGDLGVATYESPLNLLPEAKGSMPKLYAWEHGTLKIAGVLPDGTLPEEGSGAPFSGTFTARPNQTDNSVSRNGSRVMFVSPLSEEQHQLYMRKDGTTTAWVSEPEMPGAPAEPKRVQMAEMTPDGKKVLFLAQDRLLEADPGTAAGELGLYIYTDGPHPESESNLTFVARVDGYSDEQQVRDRGPVISEDGERVYFYTRSTSVFADTGLYEWDNGALHFVATTESPVRERLDLSADGRTLAFFTNEQLTSAQNKGLPAVYVYREQGETLTCASCSPTGAPVRSGAEWEAAATEAGLGKPNMDFQPRFVSSDGRYVFFTTAEPLVARDTNGLSDVYEYDTQRGQAELLTTGSGEDGAWFQNADEKGENVFVLTRDQFVGGDTDNLDDLYDVRVGGGFPQPKLSTGGCVGDECQGTPGAAPRFNTSSGFSGLGNVVHPSGSVKAKSKRLSRSQRLARALKSCRRKPVRKRRRCRAQARKRYGPKGKARHHNSGQTRR